MLLVKSDANLDKITGKTSEFQQINAIKPLGEFPMLVRFEIIDLYPATLICGKPLFYEGELYSEEHKRKITTERAGFQVVKDPKDRSKLALAINGQPIGEWFKEQFDKLFSSIRRTVAPHRKDKGLGL